MSPILLGEAAAVPVNYRLTTAEIAYIVVESGARLAFVDSETEAAVRAATSGSDIVVVCLPDHGIIGAQLAEFRWRPHATRASN